MNNKELIPNMKQRKLRAKAILEAIEKRVEKFNSRKFCPILGAAILFSSTVMT